MDAYNASILIVSFNQEKNIAQALQSAVDQETDFPIEILVADDCSTNGTLAVVWRSQHGYTGKIKILENAESLGITRNYQQQMYDWLFNLAMARHGDIGYVPQVLSVHRLHQSGAYTGMSGEQKLLETLTLIPVYNTFLDHCYAKPFAFHSRGLHLLLRSLLLRVIWERDRWSPFVTGYVVVVKVILIFYGALLRLFSFFRRIRLNRER